MIGFLNYGVIGLGAILAILSYYLLSQEQKKDIPRKDLLISIFVFMLFSICLFAAGIFSEWIKSPNRVVTEKIVSNPISKEVNDEFKYYLGSWNGSGMDIVNNRIGDTIQEKYSYKIHFEFKDENDSIIVIGNYEATPLNPWTDSIPDRIMTGYGIRNDNFIRVLFTTKANPQPIGKGIGVFCFRFSTSGNFADGYYVTRSLKDGEFVVGKVTLNR